MSVTPKSFIEDVIGPRIRNNPERAKKIGGIYKFVLDGDDGGTWIVDLDNLNISNEGEANIVISMSTPDFLELIAGRLNEMTAFLRGKIKVKGNPALALKLRVLLQEAGWEK